MPNVVNSGGLGVMMEMSCTTGLQIDCDQLSNFFDLACWGFTPYASSKCQPTIPASNIAVLQPPATMASGQADCSGYATLQDCADAISIQQIRQTQANMANWATGLPTVSTDSCSTFTANWPYPWDGISCSSLILWGLGAAAAFFFLSKVAR